MANSPKSSTALDLSRVKAQLQSHKYQQRVEQTFREVKSLQEKAVIDRTRLHVPVSF
ncbi:hypothetical protein [Hymenobacter negativus]|uniref:Uncharacterized protein n=1 Tax=Hymenobacter negativus TaxID=2795026 RepID=A0ABS0Q994_9BACT|nr:hypothetical protein [Hymenobacter negativus]MBH8559244.1 hypothetical protein [Hymenobacter negativus]